MRPAPWNDQENRAVVALYFAMLDKATAGQSYIKAAMIRDAQTVRPLNGVEQGGNIYSEMLVNRSRGSIEAKLMNCTAAHRDLTTPNNVTMDGYGYRALSNYQSSLKVAMDATLNNRAADAGATAWG